MKLLRLECLKLRAKRSTWGCIVLLILLMSGIAITTTQSTLSDQRFNVASAYVGFQWLMMLLIVVAASCVSMEFEYGTIKQLAVQAKSRWQVYLTKFELILSYSLLLHILTVLVTLGLQLIFNPRLNVLARYHHQLSLLTNLGINAGLDLYGSLMIIGLVFLLASSGHNSAVAISVGVVVCFSGEGLSSLVLNTFKTVTFLTRWNPFNMMCLQEQYANRDYQDVTHLTLGQLAAGKLIWAVIFVGVGAWLFSKRRI
ncbi:ABC transporter permease [Lactiplantibacillus daowaiensis]|uniref:ABC transporter permease n=1 Tax=Lactiplantibacillus daowaiensis TaxID=2559918 RepID=A0ABW1S3U1_9LACO|nr:ABC transporter permease [Lactiplantibacillus daowaiensis]